MAFLRSVPPPIGPAIIRTDRVMLRPPVMADYPQWAFLRSESRGFLAQWEPVWPADELSRLKGEHTAAGFGNRIRSYVLHPYTQVTDHRTAVSVGDIQAVLDGAIDPFIDAYLHQQLSRTGTS